VKEWREECFAVEESASVSNGWNLQSAREPSVATCVKQRERENVWLWDGRTRARQGKASFGCARALSSGLCGPFRVQDNSSADDDGDARDGKSAGDGGEWRDGVVSGDPADEMRGYLRARQGRSLPFSPLAQPSRL
jgi:hypothetical protein